MNRISAAAFSILISLSSASAFAANLSCSGSYLFYQVQLNAIVKGNKVVGPGKVTVSGGGQVQSAAIAVSSGTFIAGESLRFAGVSTDGLNRGAISAAFDAGSGMYIGTADVASVKGSFSTQVNCVVR